MILLPEDLYGRKIFGEFFTLVAYDNPPEDEK